VFLVFALIGYHLVSAIGAKMGHLTPSWPPGWLAHTAYVAAALGTVWSISFVPTSVAALGGLGPNYGLASIGLAAGSLGVFFKMRGRRVRQFGLIVASLIVSCISVVGAARAEWMMRHL
jgi:hypothetical protein